MENNILKEVYPNRDKINALIYKGNSKVMDNEGVQ